MDLTKIFSPLEKSDFPDDYFIGSFGLTVDIVLEKLRHSLDESDALDFLINMRNNLILVNQELKSIPPSVNLIDFDNSKVKNSITLKIIDDLREGRKEPSVSDLLLQIKPFIFWLDRLVRKINIIYELSSNQESTLGKNIKTNKLIWMDKKEDFMALFDKLFDLELLGCEKDVNLTLCQHFMWLDEKMDPNKLKHLKNNIKNKGETHKVGVKLKNLRFDDPD